MYASVRAFLDQIIDYAGLFPPAKLPLEEAVQRYLDARETSPHRWMLGRLVCPTARLRDLFALTKSRARCLSVAALGQPSAQANDLLPRADADLQAIEDYRRDWKDAIKDKPPPVAFEEADWAQEGADCKYAGIYIYETALPRAMASNLLVPELEKFGELILRAGLRGYFETPMTPAWKSEFENLCRCISDFTGEGWRHTQFGLKLRCGGLTAEAFPSDAQVAFFIGRCRSARLAWKATAGLHHPRRHWDKALQLWHHGFLNVFAAGVLAWNHACTEADLVELLADRELGDLRFEPDRMTWKKWVCSTTQIAEARANFATSFGSCSFEEPCEDLTAMGLLERDAT